MFDTSAASPGPAADLFGGPSSAVDESFGFGGFGGGLGGGGGGGGGDRGGGGGGGGSALEPPSQEQCQRYARDFEQSRGPASSGGFVSADAGKRLLERTGLGDSVLQTIWGLADLDRDGRLSLREFVCAAHLAEQARSGRSLPVEVTVEQQATLVRGVERLVSTAGPVVPRGALDDAAFSTVDTTGSRFGGRGRTLGRGGSADGLEFDSADFDTYNSRFGPGGFGSTSAGGAGAGGGGFAVDSMGGGGGGGGGLDDIDEAGSTDAHGLGQLASVFEVVARLDAGGELKRLCAEVLEERGQLERQLSRRRELEQRLKEVRSALDTMREDRRQVEMDTAATQRRISHLQDELAVVEAEVRSTEETLSMLRDASGTGSTSPSFGGGFGGRGAAPYSSPDEERRDVLSKVRAEREMLRKDQSTIEEIRMRLDSIFRQKLDAQATQQALLEKQRQTEQDRGLMLTAIEAERGKLSAMRAERLRLWEERAMLEKELAEVTQQEWLANNRAAGPRASVAEGHGAGVGVPSSGRFHTAPPGNQAQQQQSRQFKGVPNEAQQPSVVYGSVPGDFSNEAMQRGQRADPRGIRST